MVASTDTGGWEKIPAVPKALLEELERRMGEFNPALDTPDRKIWYELGRRDFLRFLRRVYDHQNNVRQ
ncbi:MAG: hypothetical protein CL581_16400 [Alteromonadaceae bacterium]|nr:hypothetical protein [Alteromonadaceae bacterium]